MIVLDATGRGAAHAQAARRFNRGEFLAASRIWQEIWHELGAGGCVTEEGESVPPRPEAVLYQALIRLAAGFERWSQERRDAAIRLIEMGLSDLEGLGSIRCELQVDRFAAQARSFLEALKDGATAPVVPVLEVEG